jgi:hypothetical protein
MQAQLPVVVSAGGVDFEWRADGSIVEKGAGGTPTLSGTDLQSQSRFIWYPAQSALRAGYGGSTETGTSIGQYSVAFGLGSTATQPGATASGLFAAATGAGATAFGATTANSPGATAFGQFTSALQSWATAMGYETTASGQASTAMGYLTRATGQYATSIGSYNTANSLNALVIGFENVGLSETGLPPSPTAWVWADPLFEIGNGWGPQNTDALVVYKNGDLVSTGTSAIFKGVVTVAPGGDIPMFTGQ